MCLWACEFLVFLADVQSVKYDASKQFHLRWKAAANAAVIAGANDSAGFYRPCSAPTSFRKCYIADSKKVPAAMKALDSTGEEGEYTQLQGGR